MFSEREKERALRGHTERPVRSSGPTPAPDTLLHVKQTLDLLLRSAPGAKQDGEVSERVFALCDTSRREAAYLYIVVARMCLDVGSHTVVADAFVAPGTPAVHMALCDAYMSTGGGRSRNPNDTAFRCIGTDADETAAWFHLLPRLTERCRMWSHRTDCAYRTLKRQQQKPAEQTFVTWGIQSPLCDCGVGVGTEVLPKSFKRAAPYLTRAAFSPLFSVPYLKEVDAPVDAPATRTGNLSEKDMLKALLQDRDVDIRKTDTGNQCRACGKEEGCMTCSRCKRARYCSKACQRADWKDHKKDCESAMEAA